MKSIKEFRESIKSTIVKHLSPIKDVCSITFVGSFVNTDKASSISDIDIIVIVDELSESLFKKIESSAQRITGGECGLPDHKVKLNMSFGPLKFNDENTIVFHLMVYDREGHRKHVIASPFTCYDWEYYKATYGISLSDIYPAVPLQLSDIVGTRRSLESYLDDLNRGVITYRHYDFSGGEISEKKETYPMDDRHKKEYAYHVMKFLMLNLLKITSQQNRRFSDTELGVAFLLLIPRLTDYVTFFYALSAWKNGNENEPQGIFDQLNGFITSLSKWFDSLEQTLPTVSFIRHGKTILNDGSFLGVGRDPSILPLDGQSITDDSYDLTYTSAMRRTIESAKLLTTKSSTISPLLNEINYGLVEGLSFREIDSKFPTITRAWQKREDPRFPEGENQADVASRLSQFVNSHLTDLNDNRIAVVTHMVVIRVLLGQFYNAEIYNWYHFQPDHFEVIKCRLLNGVLIPALTEEQRVKFRDQLMQWKIN